MVARKLIISIFAFFIIILFAVYTGPEPEPNYEVEHLLFDSSCEVELWQL